MFFSCCYLHMWHFVMSWTRRKFGNSLLLYVSCTTCGIIRKKAQYPVQSSTFEIGWLRFFHWFSCWRVHSSYFSRSKDWKHNYQLTQPQSFLCSPKCWNEIAEQIPMENGCQLYICFLQCCAGLKNYSLANAHSLTVAWPSVYCCSMSNVYFFYR